MLFLSSAPARSLQTSTYCIKCVHTQLLNPTQHTKYYPLPSDLETSKLHFPGYILGKNVHVLSQTVRTCMKIPCTHGLLSANFCPATAAVCLGKTFCCFSGTRSWRHGSGCSILHWQIYTRRVRQMRACENTVRSPDDCPFQVSSLWRSRGWVQEEFNPRRLLLVRPETGICRVLQIPSRPRRQPTVSLCSTNRDLQRYTGRQRWNSSKTKAKSSYRRPPKHSKLLFSFLFDSRALIATLRCIALTTREPLCLVHHVHAFGDRDRWPGPRPNRQPPLHLQFSSVLLQLHDRDFTSRVAKERLSNSFAFDSFVRKQTSVREFEAKKRKKTVDYRIRIPAIGLFGYFEEPGNRVLDVFVSALKTASSASVEKLTNYLQNLFKNSKSMFFFQWITSLIQIPNPPAFIWERKSGWKKKQWESEILREK